MRPSNEKTTLLVAPEPPTSLKEALVALSAQQEENARLVRELASAQVQAERDASLGMAEYLRQPLQRHLRSRLPWLLLLLLLQSFSASIMHGFQELLQSHIAVALFVTMIVGAGGNAGNQPGVIITRGLGTERTFILAHLGEICTLELMIALTMGSVLGVVAFLRVLVEFPDEVWSALVVGIATGLVVLTGPFLGIGFSLGIDKLQGDPAAGSAPLCTAVADMCGITLLCITALLVLGAAEYNSTVPFDAFYQEGAAARALNNNLTADEMVDRYKEAVGQLQPPVLPG